MKETILNSTNEEFHDDMTSHLKTVFDELERDSKNKDLFKINESSKSTRRVQILKNTVVNETNGNE